MKWGMDNITEKENRSQNCNHRLFKARKIVGIPLQHFLFANFK
jgi:hypothetical protein